MLLFSVALDSVALSLSEILEEKVFSEKHSPSSPNSPDAPETLSGGDST
jgi:hypothetical protein